tara:strand:- start:7846 stop:8145 length:300 start_codon:yes stop_codon:yes gene_type:complete
MSKASQPAFANRPATPRGMCFINILVKPKLGTDLWRPDPESNRGARICNPLRHHSAIGPERGRELLRFAGKVNPNLHHPFLAVHKIRNGLIVAQKTQSA